MSEVLPVPVATFCLGTTHEGQPCRNKPQEGSDYCYRHQPHPLAGADSGRTKPPFPKLPSAEELMTGTGIRDLTAGLLRYIADHEDADLARVYATQAMIPGLLRALDVARLEVDLSDERLAHGDTRRYVRDLEYALKEAQASRETGMEAELARVRSENRRLAARNAELESREAKRLEMQEQLQTAVAEQHQERAITDQTLDDHLQRLRRIHQTLCRFCAKRIRPLIGGTPELGDVDYY